MSEPLTFNDVLDLLDRWLAEEEDPHFDNFRAVREVGGYEAILTVRRIKAPAPAGGQGE